MRIISAAFGIMMCLCSSASAGILVFDRGLPSANLNNAAGANRSNAAWAMPPRGQGTVGDDFVLVPTGDPGNPIWRIDTIRVWLVAGPAQAGGFFLGDVFQDARLYLRTPTTPINLVVSGLFGTGTNSTSNPSIVITPVQYTGGADFQDGYGMMRQIWQVDFTNLNMLVQPGALIEFYAFGNLRNVPAEAGATGWFNHASNAALSGSSQQGANNMMRWYDPLNGTSGLWESHTGPGSVWDKDSDINVQVFAIPVPAPGAVLLAGIGVLLGLQRRRGNGAPARREAASCSAWFDRTLLTRPAAWLTHPPPVFRSAPLAVSSRRGMFRAQVSACLCADISQGRAIGTQFHGDQK